MKIVFSQPAQVGTGAVVVGATDGGTLTPSAEALNTRTGGALKRAIKASPFTGKAGQSVTVAAPAGTRLDRVLVIGIGKPKDVDELAMAKLGGAVWAALGASGSKAATVMVDPLDKTKMTAAAIAAAMAEGARLRSYRFDRYRTKGDNDNGKPTLATLTFRCRGADKARAAFRTRNRVIDGVFMTRDLVTEPPNVIYPESLAKRCRELARLGVRVEVLGVPQMKRLGMGALLGVGQGSDRPSRLVVMQWRGLPPGKSKGGAKGKAKGKGAKAEKPVCFVGKGVTFDTGGISLKPSAGMEEMKYDMGGSGVVIGLMRALAGRKARVNAVGVVGLAENMPGGGAQRPSDVVTSMSGQTIEVLNTDAEGRLVLADALHYAQSRFKPRIMIDLATLTGAIIIALGHEHAGLFSGDDKLSDQLAETGKKVGERVWRLPLGEEYDKLLKSEIADMQNISGGRGAGSITAAQFLQRFTGKTPWAHLDIAGVTWAKADTPLAPKGATAFGVRLLDRLVADHYERKG